MEKKRIYIFALAATGQGISGGDRIFIETSRILSKKHSVEIFLCNEGLKMCQRHDLDKSNVKFRILKMKPWDNLGFIVNYMVRIIEGVEVGLTLNLENNQDTIVYSASEFWMDCLPGFLLKKRFKQIQWVAAWFQTAPNPLKGFAEGKRKEKYRLNAFFYWFVQLPVKQLIQKNANLILVNNTSEVRRFSNLGDMQKVMVFLGALDLNKIRWFKEKYRNIKKIYQAVFQGRFHPQKGVLELIDIWKNVVKVKPEARLAMVGDGPLMRDVVRKIKQNGLEGKIDLFGYLFDGPTKYKIFAQSKIVLHTSFYDSGGMASAEAMAFGLPAVGFDLKSFHSYYPEGMIKVKIGDLKTFADSIIELLNNEGKRRRIGSNALNMINKNWSWDNRVQGILNSLVSVSRPDKAGKL